LRRELAESRRWGADVHEASRAQLAGGLGYYRAAGAEFALWGPEAVYIEEPAWVVRGSPDACRLRGVAGLGERGGAGMPGTRRAGSGVGTALRSIAARVVVDAAGAWARRVADLAGASVRVAPVRHQLLITAPAPEVNPADPIARIADAAVYLRPARGGLMVGGFEARPPPLDPREQAASVTAPDPPPHPPAARSTAA